MITITLMKLPGGGVAADDLSTPGSPPVGYSDSGDIYEALGRWLHQNRERVGVDIEVDESAHAVEAMRREKELSQR